MLTFFIENRDENDEFKLNGLLNRHYFLLWFRLAGSGFKVRSFRFLFFNPEPGTFEPEPKSVIIPGFKKMIFILTW